MIRSALIATSALLMVACGNTPTIEITATRASALNQSLTISVCSEEEGDCQFPPFSQNVFNSSSDKAVVDINVGTKTTDGAKLSKVVVEFGINDSGTNNNVCYGITVPLKQGSTVSFNAAIDSSDGITLSCVAAGTCTSATLCIALANPTLDFSVTPDLEIADGDVDGGI